MEQSKSQHYLEILKQITNIENCNYDPFIISSYKEAYGEITNMDRCVLCEVLEKKKASSPDSTTLERINEMTQAIQQSISPQTQALYDTNSFIAHKNQLNEDQTGLSILDAEGNFSIQMPYQVMSDAMTRGILEVSHLKIDRNLFSFLCKLSDNRLRQKHSDNVLYKANCLEPMTFTFSMYSERNRKRSFKYLNNVSKYSQTKKQKLSEKKQEKQVNEADLIQIKYMKQIQVTFTMINFTISDSFRSSLQDSEDLTLQPNIPIDEPIQAVICYMKEHPSLDSFDYQELQGDEKILKYEKKWNQKINQKIKKVKAAEYSASN